MAAAEFFPRARCVILSGAGGAAVELIVIDGCNLAYKAYGGAGDREREMLTRALAAYYCRKRILVTMVWDSSAGGDMRRILPNLKVRYAPSADEQIVRIVEESPRRSSITVITDDRSVGGRVRSYGARLVGSREFLKSWKGLPGRGRPGATPHPESKPSSESVAETRRYLDLWEKPR
jgi:predicted RNA-binding protein with PIN domain